MEKVKAKFPVVSVSLSPLAFPRQLPFPPFHYGMHFEPHSRVPRFVGKFPQPPQKLKLLVEN